jgi:DNA-binding response OmpR family regulator
MAVPVDSVTDPFGSTQKQMPVVSLGVQRNMTSESETSVSVVYVEDDELLAQVTARYLALYGVEVTLVHCGDLAVAEVLRVRPDVVLLDVMLLGVNGFEICRSLRERVDVPVIMVSGRSAEGDRVRGLESGADDYVSKPFAPRELLARIRAKARRGRGDAGPPPQRMEINELVVDLSTLTATLRGKALSLTPFEFDLLRALVQRPGRALTREQLLQRVRGAADECFDRSIDAHVSRLRNKLEDNPRKPTRLKTIRGVGYMLTSGSDS